MEQSPRLRGPSRSARILGAQGKIVSLAEARDPSFQIDGEPNPFTVFFPISITNLYTATIYVTALLVGPGAGWTDSEQNVATLGIGASARIEKNNATRATGCEGTNETITVRWRYRTGSYAGPIIGFDDFTFAIYWELISAGTVDDTDSFETAPTDGTFDGWAMTENPGAAAGTHWFRNASFYVNGAYSCELRTSALGDWINMAKTFTVGAGSRAGIYGYMKVGTSGIHVVVITTALEVQYLILIGTAWKRWGARLNPGADNDVTIRAYGYWAPTGTSVYIDFIRVVRWA